jgi:hypothetical protein
VELVFALMSIAGGWAAWHRSPVHAGESGLRVLGTIMAVLAAAIVVIVATVHFMQPLSETLQFAIMGLLVIGLTLSLVFSIQAITTPKASRLVTTLPKSVKTLTVHRDYFYRWAKYAVGLLAVCGVGLLIPGTARYVFAALGGICLLLAAVTLPLGYINARKMDRALTGLELGPWIHWQYPAAQWDAWSDILAARVAATPPFSLRRSWRKLLWPFLGIGAGVMVFSPLTLLQGALYVVAIWGFMLALLESNVWSAHLASTRLRQKLHEARPEVFIGHDGLYCYGRFLTWLGGDYYLTDASIDARPPRSMLFRFEKLVPNPYGPLQTIVLFQRVLIPEGVDGEILRLSHELAARCPQARISLA